LLTLVSAFLSNDLPLSLCHSLVHSFVLFLSLSLSLSHIPSTQTKQRKDYDDFLQDRIQTVRMLRGLSPKTTAAYQDFCIRGLEPYQNEIRHATNREVHQSTILGEQTRQHQLNIRDEDIYRALVSMRSNLALQKAQQQALMDEYEVRHDPVGGVGGATFRALTRRHSMMSGGATSATALLGGSIVSSNPAALLPTPQTGAAVTVAGKTPKVDLGAADQISTLIRQRRHSMSQVQSSSSSSSSSSQLSTAPINDDDATSTSTNTTRPAATRRLSCQMSSSAAIRELQERNARRLMDMYQHAEQPNCLYSRFPIRRDSLFGNAQPTSSFAVATSASNATRRLLAMHHRRDSLNMMQQQQQRQPNDSVFPERAVVSNTGGTAASMS